MSSSSTKTTRSRERRFSAPERSLRTFIGKRSRAKHPMAQGPAQRVLLYFGAALVLVFTLFPFYWMLISALRDPAVLYQTNSLLPGPFSFESIRVLLERTPFATYFLNSVIVAIMVTVVTLVVSTPVAYLLSRVKSRLGSAASISVLLAYMLPEILIVIPIYTIFLKLRLDNSLTGLVIALLAVTMPLGIWLMLGFFKTLPYEIEEAGFVDGATWLQVFWYIVLPIARPGLLTVGIFSFIMGWVDYVIALVLISDEAKKTLPVGLATLFGRFDASWGVILAGAVLITFPALIALAFVSRYFISGLTLGSTKG